MNATKLNLKEISILGKGTYGTVYLCEDKNGRKYCVKKMLWRNSNVAVDHRNSRKDLIEYNNMIEREIYILLHLSHPSIIRLISYHVDLKYAYMLMEYASNGTLQTLINQRQMKNLYFSQNMILNIFFNILEGLEYLHLKHVIHRDLKVENILIGDDNRVKIADFGISKILSSDTSICDNIKYGTPLYMAPEILLFNHYSFLTDVWALGCIFYELCTLEHPFASVKSIDELLNRAKKSKFMPIYCQQLNYDYKFIDIVEMMLQGNPKKRCTVKALKQYILDNFIW